MTQRTVSSPQLCIGIDLGDKFSHLCVFDRSTGEVVEESRVRTTQEAFRRRFERQDPCRIACEVGSHSPWVSRLLENAGHEVFVANPYRARWVFENDNKSDRVDAHNLARIGAMDPSLLHPVRHGTANAQGHNALIKLRDQAVQSRTKFVNCVRGLAKSHGHRLPSCSAASFHKKCRAELPAELEASCAGILALIEHLTQVIRDFDRQIDRLCEEIYEETARLRQIHGVGSITALAFVLAVEDPTRFAKSRSLGSYFGLTPAKKSSGRSDPELSITKAGNKQLRRLLVQASHYILGPHGQDCDLKRFGLRIAARGGKKAKKRAVIAVARKLAVLLHRLWVTGEPYEPLRNTDRASTQ